ncbi:MAG: hypothetical protein HOI95_29805 [Chromatiales bacterium]|nr:hypothetical protein [Chromatiales bacterium]
MKFFSKKSKETATETATGSDELSDRLLDNVAGLLRDYGDNGFDTESMDAAELARHCESWAVHALTGMPAPRRDGDDQPQTSVAVAVPQEERQFNDLRQFFKLHQREERDYVVSTTRGMRGLIGEMVDGLREAVSDEASKDELVRQSMFALNQSARGKSLKQVRTQLHRTMEVVSTVMQQRQARYKSQLASMSEQLQTLRSDLMTAKHRAPWIR